MHTEYKPRKNCKSDAALKIKSIERRRGVPKNGWKQHFDMAKEHRLIQFLRQVSNHSCQFRRHHRLHHRTFSLSLCMFFPQPSHPSHAFPHPMHAFTQPLAHGFPPSQPSVHGFFSQPPAYYGFPQPTALSFPQPIYFIPGPAYPHTAQVQPHTESCPLSDLTVNQKIQNQP